ncbi:hypothetical protein THAOC_03134 [Thalassiosira oceanica]|uniref:Uncharacterized protein n=1 Tax=Thalassiosira oceanica TaxID=159749 RepID=K0TLA8_THAOC|nr:hypothetical protein THAOC_03134 [Thalassiosira oceanica]|eukprot:EJK75156.1 hypothetical protein THAOC_03134 [Thalassiosira oceanica]
MRTRGSYDRGEESRYAKIVQRSRGWRSREATGAEDNIVTKSLYIAVHCGNPWNVPVPPRQSLNNPQDAPVRARAVQPAPTERVAHHERAPPDAAAPELVRPSAPPERLLPRRRGPRQQRLHVDPRRRRARQRARQPGQTLERPPTDDDGGACAGPGQDPPAVAEDDDGGHPVGVQDPRELPPPGSGRVGLGEHDAVLLLALTVRVPPRAPSRCG